MKKALILWLFALVAAFQSPAVIVLSDSFTYPDGDIASASGSPWVVHSGTTPASIASNELRLTGGNSADVNALLAGGPYLSNSTAVLYSSFKVRVTSQPGAGGAYFAHFKDTNTGAATGFGGRVWVNNTNAFTGAAVSNNQFRIGIGNGTSANSASGQIDQDLYLNTNYTVVTRFVPNTGLATIWLNPTAEADPSVTATDPGTATRPNAIDVVAYAFRQASGIGVVVVDNLKVGTTFADVAGANNPPSVSGIAPQTIGVGASTPALPFVVSDLETVAGSLTPSASSTDTALIPVSNIVFGGSDSNRTVTVTAAPGLQGVATVTITVTDEGAIQASTSFKVSVGIPTISTIPNQSTPKNSTSAPIPVTVGDTETPADSLAVWAYSANQALVPDGSITVGGSGANRDLTIQPLFDQTGLVTVFVVASDGISSVTNSFVLTVNPELGLIRSDDFDRPDGSLVQFDGNWLSNDTTGTNVQKMQIVGGQVRVAESDIEDVSTELPPGQPVAPSYAPASGTILYAGMTINYASLPSTSGSYFAHFRGPGTTDFRCRVFASRANAGPNSFRLGIANNTAGITAAGQFPLDLVTGVTYSVVVRCNVGTGESRLWVNPLNTSSPSVDAIDTPSPVNIEAFTFRQASGMSTVFVDDLKIGTAFADVAEPRYALSVVSTGSNSLEVSWPSAASDAGYVLQSKTVIGEAWATHPDQGATPGSRRAVTLNNPSGSQFFQLVK